LWGLAVLVLLGGFLVGVGTILLLALYINNNVIIMMMRMNTKE
jgi:hypothetical protein